MKNNLRPFREELQPGYYPFSTAVQLRFGDIDVNSHVNNVSVARLFEEGRLKFALCYRNTEYENMSASDEKLVVASSLINYIGEVFYPEPVRIYLGVAEVGANSFTQSCLMLQKGSPVAHSRVSLVRVGGGQSKPLSEILRKSLLSFKVGS